jgi:hypothetical protein
MKKSALRQESNFSAVRILYAKTSAENAGVPPPKSLVLRRWFGWRRSCGTN